VEVIDKENKGDVYTELNGKGGSRSTSTKMGNRPQNLAQVLQGRAV